MANEKRLIDANAIEYPEYFYTGEKAEDPFIEGFHQGKIDAINDIRALAPTVDAVEVVHGRWVSSGGGFDCCSKCRKVYADGYFTAMGIKPRAQFNYCPNCGAKMDGDGNG